MRRRSMIRVRRQMYQQIVQSLMSILAVKSIRIRRSTRPSSGTWATPPTHRYAAPRSASTTWPMTLTWVQLLRDLSSNRFMTTGRRRRWPISKNIQRRAGQTQAARKARRKRMPYRSRVMRHRQVLISWIKTLKSSTPPKRSSARLMSCKRVKVIKCLSNLLENSAFWANTRPNAKQLSFPRPLNRRPVWNVSS